MAYDQGLAERVRELFADRPGIVEKKMFGGLCWLINGNMAGGVYKEFLIVRVGPDKEAAALVQPHARRFDITGRPMKGWVMVSSEGYEEDEDLARWFGMGIDFAGDLPPK